LNRATSASSSSSNSSGGGHSRKSSGGNGDNSTDGKYMYISISIHIYIYIPARKLAYLTARNEMTVLFDFLFQQCYNKEVQHKGLFRSEANAFDNIVGRNRGISAGNGRYPTFASPEPSPLPPMDGEDYYNRGIGSPQIGVFYISVFSTHLVVFIFTWQSNVTHMTQNAHISIFIRKTHEISHCFLLILKTKRHNRFKGINRTTEM